jgi:hypothetical protein
LVDVRKRATYGQDDVLALVGASVTGISHVSIVMAAQPFVDTAVGGSGQDHPMRMMLLARGFATLQ